MRILIHFLFVLTPFISFSQVGTLLISADYEGVDVFIDGVNKGKTPLNIMAKTGQHTVAIKFQKNTNR